MKARWTHTAVTIALGIDYPILQGPFGGGLSSSRLVAAVSNAGGLGAYGAHYMAPDAISILAEEVRRLTSRPFSLNLWVSGHDEGGLNPSREEFERHIDRFRPYFEQLGLQVPIYPERFGYKFEDQIGALLDAAPPVFSFVYGIPEPEVLRECRKRGIKTIGAATTVAEAEALDATGVDLIVASGFEAGGHRTSFLNRPDDSLVGTFALIPQVVDKVRVPVIAAGGIADARGIVAAFALGAQAVQIGTAFLACEESKASVPHRAMLLSGNTQVTRLTRAFSGRLARGIVNRLMDELRSDEADLAPFPVQGWFVSQLKGAVLAQGRTDLLAMWAGQAASLLRHQTVSDLMRALTEETTAHYQQATFDALA